MFRSVPGGGPSLVGVVLEISASGRSDSVAPVQPQGAAIEVVPYYPSALPQAGPNALYRALAQVAQQNNLGAGVNELARLVALQQPRDAEWHLQLGDAWLAFGEPAKAVAAYEQAVRSRSQMVRGLQSLAKGLKAAGQNLRSGQVLEEAVRMAPSDAASWYQFGVRASGLGETGEAIERTQEAIALDPDLPGVYTTLNCPRPKRSTRRRSGSGRISPRRGSTLHLSSRRRGKCRKPSTSCVRSLTAATRLRPASPPERYNAWENISPDCRARVGPVTSSPESPTNRISC